MKKLKEQMQKGTKDFAFHINSDTIANLSKISAIEETESVSEYVVRVAFSDKAKECIVEKRESGASELNDTIKAVMAKGLTKKQIAALLLATTKEEE